MSPPGPRQPKREIYWVAWLKAMEGAATTNAIVGQVLCMAVPGDEQPFAASCCFDRFRPITGREYKISAVLMKSAARLHSLMGPQPPGPRAARPWGDVR